MSGKIQSLRELFEVKLYCAYECEQKLVKKGLPSMVENAGSSQLRSALEQHLEETRMHVTRRESAFASVGVETIRRTTRYGTK